MERYKKVFYSGWPKSWIWWRLEHVRDIFCKCQMLQKKSNKQKLNFMHHFKSAILPELKNCQNGTFEPVHEIQNFFWPKSIFWSIMKVPFTKIICNLFQGPPNPVFRSVKVQIGTFFKKDSRDFKNSFYLGFLWIPSKSLASLESKIRRCPFFGCS